MDNDLITLGKSLRKDTEESNINSGRIQSNFPQIERKLDIVSGGYNFTMDIPLSDVSSIVSLDMLFRADNCCECEAGSTSSTRKGTGDVTDWKDANGTTFLPNQPADNPQNGVEYQGIVTKITTVGTLDSIWFAWPGYPWFFPNGDYEEDFNTNSYGDFVLVNGEVRVPTGGVYNITYHGHLSGTTTPTSKITVMLKRRSGDTGLLDVITKEVRSVQKGNLEPDALMVSLDLVVSAICYGFEGNDTISVWIVAEDVNNLDYSNGTMTFILMGMGLGQVSGYVYYKPAIANNPIEGASVRIELPDMTSVLTNAQGYYIITDVIPGIHTITATYSTFTFSQKITVERNKMTSNVNFEL